MEALLAKRAQLDIDFMSTEIESYRIFIYKKIMKVNAEIFALSPA